MNAIKSLYLNGECPDCELEIPDSVIDGESCLNCEHVFNDIHPDDYDDSMDGDFDSGMASAGFGMDEDY